MLTFYLVMAAGALGLMAIVARSKGSMTSPARVLKEALGFVLLLYGGLGLIFTSIGTALALNGRGLPGALTILVLLVTTPVALYLGAQCRPSWRSGLGGILLTYAFFGFFANTSADRRSMNRFPFNATHIIRQGSYVVAALGVGLIIWQRYRKGIVHRDRGKPRGS